jgi:excinuclease ABC A subunit
VLFRSLTCVTGVAGSGKSSLIHEVFARQHPQAVVVDQSAAGRSSRSNPATYIGVFDFMRRELAAATGGSASLFSFNSSGACPACKGMGVVRIEMSFLDDVQMICGECQGRRFRLEVLDLKCRGKSIDEILRLTVGEASEFFAGKEIRRRLQVLAEVGLGYLEIGQSLSSLSGGEAQRIKLAAELHKRGGVYILDEPTTGLHPADIAKLMAILQRLVSGRNTVVVIEHNLEVISQSDWVIDLGPEGGREGGEIVAQGTPEELAQVEGSHTGRYLARHFRGIMESGGAPC